MPAGWTGMPRPIWLPRVVGEPQRLFSESGIEALIRSGGKRRQQRFAGSTRASNAASRWGTPRRDAGIQARITTGSLCWVGGGDSLDQE
jgi:hypothetical protein